MAGAEAAGRVAGVKAVTVRQPWASLIVAGIKTIETRSWSTRHRGPLAIHAGKVHYVGPWNHQLFEATERVHGGMAGYPDSFPLGAVVGTVRLVDVVSTDPLVGYTSIADSGYPLPYEYIPEDPETGRTRPLGDRKWWLEDQRPLGHFGTGRFAWLLADFEPFKHPVPARGRQGLWTWDESQF